MKLSGLTPYAALTVASIGLDQWIKQLVEAESAHA